MKILKKNIILILIIIIVFCVKSCVKVKMTVEKTKVLNCTSKVQTDSYTSNDTIIFYFHKDYYLESYEQTLVVDYGSNMDFANNQYEMHKGSCNDAKNLSGFSCNVEKSNDGKSVISKLKVIVSELDDESLKYTSLKGKTVSYDYIKNKMVNSDPSYTCEDY